MNLAEVQLEHFLKLLAAQSGGGGGSMPVLVLAADPTTTPTAGLVSQCGTFAGNLYQHLTAVEDTHWLNVTAVVGLLVQPYIDGNKTFMLDVLAQAMVAGTSIANIANLSSDPTITPPALPASYPPGTVVSWTSGSTKYYQCVAASDSPQGWRLLTDLEVLRLADDPRVVSAGGGFGQMAVYGGTLFLHATDANDTRWFSLADFLIDEVAFVPTSVATPGVICQKSGLLYLHVETGSTTAWMNLNQVRLLVSTLYGVKDALATVRVVVDAAPDVTPPATNYQPGTVAYWPAADAYWWKVEKSNTVLDWMRFDGGLNGGSVLARVARSKPVLYFERAFAAAEFQTVPTATKVRLPFTLSDGLPYTAGASRIVSARVVVSSGVGPLANVALGMDSDADQEAFAAFAPAQVQGAIIEGPGAGDPSRSPTDMDATGTFGITIQMAGGAHVSDLSAGSLVVQVQYV